MEQWRSKRIETNKAAPYAVIFALIYLSLVVLRNTNGAYPKFSMLGDASFLYNYLSDSPLNWAVKTPNVDRRQTLSHPEHCRNKIILLDRMYFISLLSRMLIINSAFWIMCSSGDCVGQSKVLMSLSLFHWRVNTERWGWRYRPDR